MSSLQRAWADGGGRSGLVVLATLLVVALLGPLALPDPRAQPDLASGTLRPPTAAHLLGTDHLSRDVLSRVVTGARVSIGVAVGAVLLAVTLGAGVGLVAGYAGGWLDAALMRTVDAALAVPRIFLLLLVTATMERIPLGALVLMLGVTGWFGTSRLVRSEVLRLRALDFVRGAEALGASPGRIVGRHLLPNVLRPLTVATTLAVGDVILLEAGLSFLGLGVQPPMPSWGGMIYEARPYLVDAPWTSLAPGVAIVLAVLSVNLVGEALSQERGGLPA